MATPCGTRHAVAARRARDGAELAVQVAHARHQRELLRREQAGPRAVGEHEILLHVPHGAHAAEEERHLGLVPDPLERPLGRGPLDGRLVPHGLHLRRHVARDGAAAHRLHDDDAEALAGRQLQPLAAGLVVLVHVVELDLDELPEVGGGDDRLEVLVEAVEAEAEVADTAVGQGTLGGLELALLQHGLPVIRVQPVQQVEVDVVVLQALQLDAQDAVEVVGLLDVPHRHLGGHLDALAVAALERLPEPDLARVLVVHPGGVDVVHAAVDGVVEHLRGQGVVDALEVGLAVVVGEHRQAHGAEAEGRGLEVDLSEVAVLHAPMVPD